MNIEHEVIHLCSRLSLFSVLFEYLGFRIKVLDSNEAFQVYSDSAFCNWDVLFVIFGLNNLSSFSFVFVILEYLLAVDANKPNPRRSVNIETSLSSTKDLISN